MKKASEFKELSRDDAVNKRKELVREITKAKVSLDVSGLQSLGGLSGAQRKLRSLERHLATKASK